MRLLSLFIASRYLSFKDKDKNIAFMVKICFLGILIGTFALMLTLIITNGFEKVIHEKMQGINSQIIITSPGNRLAYHDLKKLLISEFDAEIKDVGARALKQAIIDKDGMQSVIFLEGIDGQSEVNVSTVHSKIIRPFHLDTTGKKALLKNLGENEIIIGYKTASNLNICIGDTLKFLIPEPTSKHRLYLEKKFLKVVGIFNIGLEEYDNNFAFCSLESIKKIFDEDGVDQVTIKLDDSYHKTIWPLSIFRPDSEKIMIQKLQKRLPQLQISSWKDLYPALVSSLKLEKYVMFFILALITLVASMNMISLLFMQIQQKRRDLAILKAIGMPNCKIRQVFLLMGMLITFFASLSGLGLAAAAGYALERYPIIELPDVYYVSYLPARLDLEIFIVVLLVTMLLGFMATWLPSRQVKHIKIAEVLRQE